MLHRIQSQATEDSDWVNVLGTGTPGAIANIIEGLIDCISFMGTDPAGGPIHHMRIIEVDLAEDGTESLGEVIRELDPKTEKLDPDYIEAMQKEAEERGFARDPSLDALKA